MLPLERLTSRVNFFQIHSPDWSMRTRVIAAFTREVFLKTSVGIDRNSRIQTFVCTQQHIHKPWLGLSFHLEIISSILSTV